MPRHTLLPLAFAALLLLAGLSWPDGLHALPHRGAGALGILLCTIVLWTSGALPLAVTSVLAIGLLAASGVAAPFSKAAAGYATDVVFFLISANLMTQGVVNSGLIDRLAAALVRRVDGSSVRALRFVTIIGTATAIVMPSALVRIKTVMPLIDRVDDLLLRNDRPSNFLKASGLTLSLLGTVASAAVISGGGLTIVAAIAIQRFYQPISWVTWFLMMSLPSLIVFAIVSTRILRAYPPEPFARPDDLAKPLAHVAREEYVPGKERVALAILVSALALWVAGSTWGMDLSLPAIFGAAAFALPGVGLITRETVRRMRWEEILIVGTALSLASALQDSGAVQWVAQGLFGLFPTQPPLLLVYAQTILLALVVRQIFLQPAPPMAIVIPLVIALAKTTGANPLIVAMLAAGVVGMVQFFPFQSPPAFLCHTMGIFSVRDQLRISPVLVAATIVVMLASALLYWPLLHAIGWI